jgi:hypothetical protein
LKPSEQADRASLRRTTITIAQPFEGPKDVTAASVRLQQQGDSSVSIDLVAASGKHRHLSSLSPTLPIAY